MIREIKFRAWHPTNKTMVIFDNAKASKDAYIAMQMCGLMADVHAEGSGLLMQYTGLKDKNGKEIYEGDIYQQGDQNIRYKVIFNDCQFVGSQIGNKSLAGLTYFSDYIEVIGNIYENKDLLDQ